MVKHKNYLGQSLNTKEKLIYSQKKISNNQQKLSWANQYSQINMNDYAQNMQFNEGSPKIQLGTKNGLQIIKARMNKALIKQA